VSGPRNAREAAGRGRRSTLDTDLDTDLGTDIIEPDTDTRSTP
jgi:hypothetical protein